MIEANTRSPRSADDVAIVLRERPDYWEYLAYAGLLYVGLQQKEGKYRDFLIGFAPPQGDALDCNTALARLDAAIPDALALGDNLMAPFTETVLEMAFSEDGKSSDADLIQHLALRTVDGYELLMDWAQDLRSARVPTEMRDAFKLGANLICNAVQELRDYVHTVCESMDSLESLIAGAATGRGSDELVLKLTVTVDNEARRLFAAELDRIHKEGLLGAADNANGE